MNDTLLGAAIPGAQGDYLWEYYGNKRVTIPNWNMGSCQHVDGGWTYPQTAGSIAPMMIQCLNDDNCVSVSQDTNGGANGQACLEYGSEPANGYYGAYGFRAWAMKLSRESMCNDPNVPEPYRSWCATKWCLSKNGMGKCDTLMKTYCATAAGKTDPGCACINSPVAGTKYNPFCEDSKCITGGYPTQGMITSLGTGCNIVDCSTAITLINNGGVQLSDPTVTQRCGSNATTEDTTTKTGYWAKLTSLNTQTKYMVGGVAIVVLIAAAYFAFRATKKKR